MDVGYLATHYVSLTKPQEIVAEVEINGDILTQGDIRSGSIRIDGVIRDTARYNFIDSLTRLSHLCSLVVLHNNFIVRPFSIQKQTKKLFDILLVNKKHMRNVYIEHHMSVNCVVFVIDEWRSNLKKKEKIVKRPDNIHQKFSIFTLFTFIGLATYSEPQIVFFMNFFSFYSSGNTIKIEEFDRNVLKKDTNQIITG